MATLKVIHPYEGNEKLICHYAEDDEGNKYFILQVETGIIYDGAIDVFPCKYTYEPTDEKIDLTN